MPLPKDAYQLQNIIEDKSGNQFIVRHCGNCAYSKKEKIQQKINIIPQKVNPVIHKKNNENERIIVKRITTNDAKI